MTIYYMQQHEWCYIAKGIFAAYTVNERVHSHNSFLHIYIFTEIGSQLMKKLTITITLRIQLSHSSSLMQWFTALLLKPPFIPGRYFICLDDPPDAEIEDSVVRNITLLTANDDYQSNMTIIWDPPVYKYRPVNLYLVRITMFRNNSCEGRISASMLGLHEAVS